MPQSGRLYGVIRAIGCKVWIATITQDEMAWWRVIASQVNQTISQDACIMHASWEAHKGVNEATLMVTDCLQHHGWIQLPVHVVLTIRAARTFNSDVGPVDGPSCFGKSRVPCQQGKPFPHGLDLLITHRLLQRPPHRTPHQTHQQTADLMLQNL